MAKIGISETQWKIMEIVWEKGSVTAAEVIAALTPETGWNHQTVRTLLARLVQKGALGIEQVKNYYLYSPLVSREESIREEGESFLNRVFQGNAEALLVHFAKEGKISQETLDRLQSLLDMPQE